MNLHRFGIRQEAGPFLLGKLRIHGQVTEPFDDGQTAAMFVIESTKGLLAQTSTQLRIEVFLLECNVRAGLFVEPAGCCPRLLEVPCPKPLRQIVEARPEYAVIVAERLFKIGLKLGHWNTLALPHGALNDLGQEHRAPDRLACTSDVTGDGMAIMCRLYGLRANEPTKVECSLVHAQNALMVQSEEDLSGTSHGHGWGVATYEDHEPHVERQAWAAFHGEHFRRAAARVYAQTVLAHVRRATVGPPAMENTHPFADGRWALIHNGTVPGFGAIRPRMLAVMTPARRTRIGGATDSEHLFQLLLSLHDRQPAMPLTEILRAVAQRVRTWCREAAPDRKVGLNLILTDGIELAGTRWGRSLYHVERHDIYDCEICGFPHIRHDPATRYHAVVLASEPLTHESWTEVPKGSVYSVTADMTLSVESLWQPAAA